MAETKTAKKLTGGIIAIIVLAVCLCITTFALVYETVSVENNLFHTGEVKINLNDGKPVIREHEFLFEPGMTVVKDFFIENDSTCFAKSIRLPKQTKFAPFYLTRQIFYRMQCILCISNLCAVHSCSCIG